MASSSAESKRSKPAEKASLEIRCATAERRVQQLEEALRQEREQHIRETEKSVALYKRQHTESTERWKKCREREEDLDKKEAILRKVQDDLNRDIKERDKTNDQINIQIADLNKFRGDIALDWRNAQAKEAELDKLQKDLEAKQKDLQAEVPQLQEQLAEARRKIADLESGAQVRTHPVRDMVQMYRQCWKAADRPLSDESQKIIKDASDWATSIYEQSPSTEGVTSESSSSSRKRKLDEYTRVSIEQLKKLREPGGSLQELQLAVGTALLKVEGLRTRSALMPTGEDEKPVRFSEQLFELGMVLQELARVNEARKEPAAKGNVAFLRSAAVHCLLASGYSQQMANEARNSKQELESLNQRLGELRKFAAKNKAKFNGLMILGQNGQDEPFTEFLQTTAKKCQHGLEQRTHLLTRSLKAWCLHDEHQKVLRRFIGEQTSASESSPMMARFTFSLLFADTNAMRTAGKESNSPSPWLELARLFMRNEGSNASDDASRKRAKT